MAIAASVAAALVACSRGSWSEADVSEIPGLAREISGPRFRIQAPSERSLGLAPTGDLIGTVVASGSSDHSSSEVFVPGTGILARTDVRGQFRIRSIPVGTYAIEARRGGFQGARSDDVEVVADKVATASTITLLQATGAEAAYGTIAGIASPGNVSITAVAADGTALLKAVSTSEGSYQLKLLPAGQVDLVFRRPHYHDMRANVPVLPDQVVSAPGVSLVWRPIRVSTLSNQDASGEYWGEGDADLALDGDRYLYQVETRTDTIRRIDLATGQFTLVAGSGEGYQDGTGTNAKFHDPQGLALDGKGNLYVADFENYAIRKIVLATGDVTTVARLRHWEGENNSYTSYECKPRRLALDSGKSLLFVSAYGNAIIRLDLASVDQTTWGRCDYWGYGYKDGASPQYNQPFGIALAKDGKLLYVADRYNRMIRGVATATGYTETIAGSGDNDSADGFGKDAKFRTLAGLSLDGFGNLLLTDKDSHKILMYGPNGEVKILAGTGDRDYRDDWGGGAKFRYPGPVVAGPSGRIYVHDFGNGRIRVLD